MKQDELLSKRQREDRALNRVLLWFGGAVMLELMIVLFNRFYIRFGAGTTQFTHVFGYFILGLGLAAAFCTLGLGARLVMRRKVEGVKTTHGALILFSLAVALICFVTLWWRGAGVRLLYSIVPILAVLALIYYLYQREFFAICVLGGGALLAAWMLRQAGGRVDSTVSAVFVAVGLCAAAVAVLTRVLQKGRGTLVIGGRKRRVLPKKATYSLIYAACAITAVILVACLLLGPIAAYYAMFITVAWIFVMAIYYTVRLM